MIAGGGIGDGAIDGVVNLYVIDDDSRAPIAGAEVQVGTLLGSTDADGLFVAEGVVGPQDVTVKAAGKRKELWVGVNGANVTINLEKDNSANPASKTLSGAVTGFDTVPFTPAANHLKVAVIDYSKTTRLGDPANELPTPSDGNVCFSATGTDPCTFSVVSRTGKVALFAMIFDLDTKGTETGDDDTLALLGFAVRQGIDTATASTGQDLTVIAAANTQDLSIDFGSSPAGLTQKGVIVGVEVGEEGVLQVASSFSTTVPSTLKAPRLTALSGATGYRLTGFASDGTTSQSAVLRRNLPGPALAGGEWIAPPTGLALTKTGGSWTNASGAVVHSVELKSGSSQLLNVSVFDTSRTSFEIPAIITLPSGPIDAAVNALAAPSFDAQDFSLDETVETIDRVGGRSTTIN